MDWFEAQQKNTRRFYESVYEAVRMIPEGKVYTYGAIACLLGYPRRARLVGTALKNMPPGEVIPAWRVVNTNGRIAPGWPEQKNLLEEENVIFITSTRVDLKRFLWNPDDMQ